MPPPAQQAPPLPPCHPSQTPTPPPRHSRAQGHDDTVIPLIVMCTLVVVGILVSLVGLVMFSLQIPVYARPLSHHTDILRQY